MIASLIICRVPYVLMSISLLTGIKKLHPVSVGELAFQQTVSSRHSVQSPPQLRCLLRLSARPTAYLHGHGRTRWFVLAEYAASSRAFKRHASPPYGQASPSAARRPCQRIWRGPISRPSDFAAAFVCFPALSVLRRKDATGRTVFGSHSCSTFSTPRPCFFARSDASVCRSRACRFQFLIWLGLGLLIYTSLQSPGKTSPRRIRHRRKFENKLPTEEGHCEKQPLVRGTTTPRVSGISRGTSAIAPIKIETVLLVEPVAFVVVLMYSTSTPRFFRRNNMIGLVLVHRG